MIISTAKRIEQVEEYYFSKKLAEVRKLDSPDFRVINLGIGSPDLAPSDNTVDALIKSAQHPDNHGYQSYKGIPSLRKGISDYYKRFYNVALDPETMILPLMGSKEGIMHISMAFINDGDEVLIPDPGYPTYSSVTKIVGGVARPYAMKEELGWKLDIEELKKQDLSGVKIMWVNFPHMPTGSLANKEELKELVELAKKNKFLIVNDNPYSMILNEDPASILEIAGAEEVALELNSLSKSHNMAGWRMGWVAGSPDYLDAILKVKSNMDSGMFMAIQNAAAEALNNGEEWFRMINNEYAERKKIAKKIFDSMECSYSEEQSGMFLWAKAPEKVHSIEKWIDEILYSTKVFITPGFIFGRAGERYLRISLCSKQNALNEAHERISKFLNGVK
jgi:LL-diaminopimelate aminotransferase